MDVDAWTTGMIRDDPAGSERLMRRCEIWAPCAVTSVDCGFECQPARWLEAKHESLRRSDPHEKGGDEAQPGHQLVERGAQHRGQPSPIERIRATLEHVLDRSRTDLSKPLAPLFGGRGFQLRFGSR